MQWVEFKVVDEAGGCWETLRLPAPYVRQIEALAAERGVSFEAELAAMLKEGLRAFEQGEMRR